MAKTVFRPNEIKTKSGDKVTLKLIHDYTPEKVEEAAEVEEYIGPTADDLRKEAEAFKAGWEIEKKRMLDEAQKSADEIVKKAEDAAFAEVKRQTDQAQVIKADAEKEAQDIVNKAQAEAQEIIAKAHSEENEIRDSAYRKGYDEGQKSGYNDGQSELNRLIERVHKIVESVMNRREEILRDTEQQIVDLVILMTRKIVKIISENQKGVVLSNVLSALKKVKTRCSVIYPGIHRKSCSLHIHIGRILPPRKAILFLPYPDTCFSHIHNLFSISFLHQKDLVTDTSYNKEVLFPLVILPAFFLLHFCFIICVFFPLCDLAPRALFWQMHLQMRYSSVLLSAFSDSSEHPVC